MTDVLHVGALLPAAVGACCTVGGRRGLLDLGSSLVMLAAMLDLASGAGLVHPLLWAALLVVLAVVSAARSRIGRAPAAVAAAAGRTAVAGHRSAMVIHTSGGLMIMAALVCIMAGHETGGLYADSSISVPQHHAGGMSLVGALVAAAIAAYVALSTRLGIDAARGGRRLVAIELGSMAVSVAVMGLAAAI